MYVSDDVIYLQLHKTACTHITRVLQAHLGGKTTVKHSPLSIDPGDRLVLGSVRNPWDWYVSLWAFGCMAKGSLFSQLTGSQAKILVRLARRSVGDPKNALARMSIIPLILASDTGKWEDVYRDASDPQAFRDWLRGILSKEGQVRISDSYSVLPLNEFCGFLTYRFISLFSDQSAWKQESKRISNYDEIESYFNENYAVERFIRQEYVENDLLDIIKSLNVEIKAEHFSGNRTNSSSHKKVSFYYDEESLDLVAQKDKFIIEKFSYKRPVIDQQ